MIFIVQIIVLPHHSQLLIVRIHGKLEEIHRCDTE